MACRDRAGGCDFDSVTGKAAQERFRHLTTTGVVFAHEEDEGPQDALHCDDVDKATIKAPLLFKDADVAVSHLAVEALSRFIDREREQNDLVKFLATSVRFDRMEQRGSDAASPRVSLDVDGQVSDAAIAAAM